MRVNIRQKNIEVTPALREYIEEKIIRVAEKFLQGQASTDLPMLDIDVERTTTHHRKGDVFRIAAKLCAGKLCFYADAHGADIRAACDVLEEELRHEMYGKKNKISAVFRRGARAFKKSMRFDPAARLWRKGRIRDEI
ncbi:MAG: ribosome-associated translation inhibitor RaiA [bacterium]|nr:ribosome-associated translation inhibitor RaiA [bacterium]MDZ4285488.1 ribosome-associated translation inhibitor RaiA [Candidatus Sungbacteria bacterium]